MGHLGPRRFTTGEPWIAANPDRDEIDPVGQREDPWSVLAHHRRLVALRQDDPVVTEGGFRLLLPDHEQVWAFLRSAPMG